VSNAAISPSLTSRFPVRKIIGALLVAQALIGVGLIALDVTGYDGDQAIEPNISEPIAPGDQTRRYTPTSVPSRGKPDDGRQPFRLPTEMGALEFRFVDDDTYGRIMVLEGAINPGDSDRFLTALDEAQPRPDIVALHSPGGSVRDALTIGAKVRQTELDTMIIEDATCASACPIILFSGVERYVSKGAWVGMHQSYMMDVSMVTTRQAVSEIQYLQGDVMDHTREMGVDPAVHIHAFRTPPESIYYLVEDELIEYAVATVLTD
jgi:hypothetical protein